MNRLALFSPTKLTLLLSFIILAGCASMDLRMDKVVISNDYGNIEPRVDANCSFYNKGANEPDPSQYYVMASYVVQENPTVVTSRSVNSMICYIYDEAIENGADAIIVDEIGTTSVAGGFARTSPIVRARAIRFKGDPPQR